MAMRAKISFDIVKTIYVDNKDEVALELLYRLCIKHGISGLFTPGEVLEIKRKQHYGLLRILYQSSDYKDELASEESNIIEFEKARVENILKRKAIKGKFYIAKTY